MRRFYPFLLACALGLPANAQQSVTPSSNGNPGAPDASAAIDEMPVTVRPNGSEAKKPGDTDSVIGVPPLPKGKTSMIGGTIDKVDGVHNKLQVKVFAGGKWDLAFDERTHFYRNGQETTFEALKKGERVYVDTMLDGHRILARNVRIMTKSAPADARGQVLRFNRGVMSVQDTLSRQPVEFRVDSGTEISRQGKAGSLADVQAGSLIEVRFSPDKANKGVAREINVLASPGQSFVFAGKVMHVDLRGGIMAIENHTDGAMYDIAFDRDSLPTDVMVGSEVSVSASFDGRQYKATDIKTEVASPTASSAETKTPSL